MALHGKKIVIIGGSSGIGKATARAAAEAGAHVVIAGRTEERLQQAREEIAGKVEACVIDVRDRRAMDYCIEQISPFDHLVYTAAEVQAKPFLEIEPEEARHAFDIKFWGPFAAVQQAVPGLLEGGSITLFSGGSAHKPVRGLSVISAANGAVEALVRTLAIELSPIRVNAVSPGFVDTHAIDEERRTRMATALPARRVGEAQDIAEAVLFLMQNPYVTGTVLHIDGGNRLV